MKRIFFFLNQVAFYNVAKVCFGLMFRITKSPTESFNKLVLNPAGLYHLYCIDQVFNVDTCIEQLIPIYQIQFTVYTVVSIGGSSSSGCQQIPLSLTAPTSM
uniref:Uncharacterized protein n=1 Tax=Cacopsylla melanoneura TaxID=428564 RepID=A0A8D8WT70_9HEMI